MFITLVLGKYSSDISLNNRLVGIFNVYCNDRSSILVYSTIIMIVCNKIYAILKNTHFISIAVCDLKYVVWECYCNIIVTYFFLINFELLYSMKFWFIIIWVSYAFYFSYYVIYCCGTRSVATAVTGCPSVCGNVWFTSKVYCAVSLRTKCILFM